MSDAPLTEEHVTFTEFDPPRDATKLGKARAAAVATQAWFDAVPSGESNLWIKSKDGDCVCIPKAQLETLKKLIRRGRNP